MSKRVNFHGIGMVIQRRRKELGLSVDQAALKGGVSISQWQKVEASQRYPTAHSIAFYCQALEISVSDLLEEAVSFKDYIAGKITGDLFTYVVRRDGVDDPWEVVPSNDPETDRQEVWRYADYMRKLGHMDDNDDLHFRPSTAEEKERWRLCVEALISCGDLDPSGEGLDTIRAYPVYIGSTFNSS